MGIIRVDQFLSAKRRFENVRFSESLSKWGVPSVVCQEVEDMRLLFITMSDNILNMNQEQMQLQKKLKALPSL